MRKFLALCGLVLGIAGCDVAREEYALSTSEAGDLSRILQSMPDPIVATIPTSGKMTFDGHALVTAQTAGTGSVLRGDATIIVDFGLNKITGDAVNFVGVNGAGEYALYDGYISLATGNIGALNAHDITAIYSGRLDANGDFFILLGEMSGQLRGNGVEGVRLHEGDAILGYNGVLIGGSVTFEAVR